MSNKIELANCTLLELKEWFAQNKEVRIHVEGYVSGNGEVADLVISRAGNPYGELLLQWERYLHDLNSYTQEALQDKFPELAVEEVELLPDIIGEFLATAEVAKSPQSASKQTVEVPLQIMGDHLYVRNNLLISRTVVPGTEQPVHAVQHRSTETKLRALLRKYSPMQDYLGQLKFAADKATSVSVAATN